MENLLIILETLIIICLVILIVLCEIRNRRQANIIACLKQATNKIHDPPSRNCNSRFGNQVDTFAKYIQSIIT